MDKFVIQTAPKEQGYRAFNIRMETYETIQRIKEETGMAIVDIVDAMVRFCAQRLVIEEE